jgi:divalent metal cation (Fe/Co/Zn/Cd) transporter
MNYLHFKLAALVVGMVILMVGILLYREHEQNFQSALKDSVVWGAGFFISYCVEFWLFANAGYQ